MHLRGWVLVLLGVGCHGSEGEPGDAFQSALHTLQSLHHHVTAAAPRSLSIRSSLLPAAIAKRLPSSKRKKREVDYSTSPAFSRALQQLDAVAQQGNADAALVLADIHLWGRFGITQNATKAMQIYQTLADLHGDARAQSALGFLHSTDYHLDIEHRNPDQGSALLYHTFAALAGKVESEMTLGYRYWVGIGVKQSCQEALPFYKSAADKAIEAFYDGTPGGRQLTPQKQRQADLEGGLFGAGASVVSTVHNHQHQGHNHQHQHIHHPSTRQEWDDVLEFYAFHADRGDPAYMFRLARIYYQGFGSVVVGKRPTYLGTTRSPVFMADRGGNYGNDIGGRDFPRALKWFMRIARAVWPRDVAAAYLPLGNPKKSKNNGAIGPYNAQHDSKLKVDDQLGLAAQLAAGFLGRMFLRGEGVPQDFGKAFLWYSRGASMGDRESHNGLGIMYRDGWGVPVDKNKAHAYFQTAANADHSDAHVNLCRFYHNMGERNLAIQHCEHAIRLGDNFLAYYYLASIHSANVPQATKNPPQSKTGQTDNCPVSVSFYKLVTERADWKHEVWWEAERDYAEGDYKRAFLGYWIMAERGYEVAQNNVAWMLDQDKQSFSLPWFEKPSNNFSEHLALTFYTRSAAQDNTDSLVKMGDYYLKGLGVAEPNPEKAAACYQSAAGTHTSSMAMHNLGWMHENGIGVTKDFHLAKRYYDTSLDTNMEANLPVTLSLFKLYLKSFYYSLGNPDPNLKLLSLFSNPEIRTPTDPTAQTNPAQPEKPEDGKYWWSSFRKVKNEIYRRWTGEEPLPESTDPNVPADPTPADKPATGDAPDSLQRAKDALQNEENPLLWAKKQQARERAAQRAREDENNDFWDQTPGGDDEFYDFEGLGGEDDFLETVAIVGLCLAVAWLVYLRQARYENRNRNNNNANPPAQPQPPQQPVPVVAAQ